MNNWFECKVKYEKMDAESGKSRKVTEPYLLDAVSFTDAETRINAELEAYVSGDFHVTNIKRANYSDIIANEAGDRWFKCKVTYVSLDEEKGIERRTPTYMLVQANNCKEAYENIEESMKGMISDYEITAVQESPIMDIFPYYNTGEDVVNSDSPSEEELGRNDSFEEETDDSDNSDDDEQIPDGSIK